MSSGIDFIRLSTSPRLRRSKRLNKSLLLLSPVKSGNKARGMGKARRSRSKLSKSVTKQFKASKSPSKNRGVKRKLRLSDSNSPMKKTKQASPNASCSLDYSVISSDEDTLTDKVKEISINESDAVDAPAAPAPKKDILPVNDSVIIVDDSEDELPAKPTKRSPKKKYGIVKTPRGKKKPKKDVVNKLMDNTIIILDDDDEVAAPIKDSKSEDVTEVFVSLSPNRASNSNAEKENEDVIFVTDSRFGGANCRNEARGSAAACTVTSGSYAGSCSTLAPRTDGFPNFPKAGQLFFEDKRPVLQKQFASLKGTGRQKQQKQPKRHKPTAFKKLESHKYHQNSSVKKKQRFPIDINYSAAVDGCFSLTPGTPRQIVVDGSNVAIGNSRQFEEVRLKLVVDYFKNKGHIVKVFLPRHRHRENLPIIQKLYSEGIVVFTPSRIVDGRKITSYDDRYILEYASKCKGIVVSGDRFRDLYDENPEWKETIERRLLEPTFVENFVMFPPDPLGRSGPNLKDFLLH